MQCPASSTQWHLLWWKRKGRRGREMNEVMAEVAQHSSWETKAINFRAEASSRVSAYLTSLKTDNSLLPHTQHNNLLSSAFRTFQFSLQPAEIKTGRGRFYCPCWCSIKETKKQEIAVSERLDVEQYPEEVEKQEDEACQIHLKIFFFVIRTLNRNSK